MLCCCGKSRTPDFDPDQLILDVKHEISEKVWSQFVDSHGFWRKKCLRRKDYEIDVPLNFYVFERVDQNFTPRGKQGAAQDGQDVVRRPHPEFTSPEAISLETVFNNDTAEKQLYKFRLEKTRRSEVSVTYQRGFTIGGKTNFSLGLPSVGVETEMQLSVTKSEGQTFEETLTMEATSDISVGPSSHYVAKVEMEEQVLHADFEVIMRMSIPQGRAPVYIRPKGSQDDHQCSVLIVRNLPMIFKKYKSARVVKMVDNPEKDDVTKIDFKVQGVVRGILMSNHRINLSSDEPEEVKADARARVKHVENA